MAVLRLDIETKDKSSTQISNVSASFEKLSNKIDIAKKSAGSFSSGFMNMTAGIGGAIVIVKAVIDSFKKLDNFFKKVGGEGAQAWNDLKQSFKIIGEVVSNLVVPAIMTLAKNISLFIKSAEGLNVISNIASGIAFSFNFLKEIFITIANSLKNTLLKEIERIQAAFSNLNENSDNTINSLNILKTIFLSVGVAINVAVSVVGNLITAFINLAKVAMEAGELLFNIFTGKWDKVEKSAKKTFDALKNFGGGVVDSFKDVVNTASQSFSNLNKNLDIEKTLSNSKKNFEVFKNQTTEILKNQNNQILQNNNEIITNNLQFTQELLSQYKEYVVIKQDLINKNYANEQEYFEKLNKLRELEKIKGIKELEDYYNSQNKIIEKAKINVEGIKKFFEGLNFSNVFNTINEGLTGAINSINNSIASASSGIGKAISELVNELKKIEDSSLSDAEKFKEKLKIIFTAVGEIAGSVFNAIGGIISASFGYYNNLLQTDLANIENSYNNLYKKLEGEKEKYLKIVEKQAQKELEILGFANKTELELAQEKLEELKGLRETYKDEEVEARLEALDEYYQSLDNQTDADIQAAYERQKAKILETEEKKRLDLEEQISTQQKEVKKLQILDESNKKKTELERNYEKKRQEAEKQRINELNEKEKQIFEANKANQIASIWVQTATGIATALATSMQLGPIAGPIMGGILTTLLLTNAGVQTGLIASQTYTPKNFATGGIVVGEAGRELVELPRGARVYNNDQTERMLSGGDIVNEINVYIDSEKIEQFLIRKRKSLNLRYL